MITLGKPAQPGDVVDALLDCHARIRSFLALALRLARASGPSETEARDAAAAVHRYFSLGLPLHARDEEESILPRLRGRDPAVDAALDTMHREHAEHEAALARLVSACATVMAQPSELPRVAPALEATALDLQRQLEAHLDAEERLVFPVIRAQLGRDVQEVILAELRARRG